MGDWGNLGEMRVRERDIPTSLCEMAHSLSLTLWDTCMEHTQAA
jgi:hypothetical protein